MKNCDGSLSEGIPEATLEGDPHSKVDNLRSNPAVYSRVQKQLLASDAFWRYHIGGLSAPNDAI